MGKPYKKNNFWVTSHFKYAQTLKGIGKSLLIILLMSSGEDNKKISINLKSISIVDSVPETLYRVLESWTPCPGFQSGCPRLAWQGRVATWKYKSQNRWSIFINILDHSGSNDDLYIKNKIYTIFEFVSLMSGHRLGNMPLRSHFFLKIYLGKPQKKLFS